MAAPTSLPPQALEKLVATGIQSYTAAVKNGSPDPVGVAIDQLAKLLAELGVPESLAFRLEAQLRHSLLDTDRSSRNTEKTNEDLRQELFSRFTAEQTDADSRYEPFGAHNQSAIFLENSGIVATAGASQPGSTSIPFLSGKIELDAPRPLGHIAQPEITGLTSNESDYVTPAPEVTTLTGDATVAGTTQNHARPEIAALTAGVSDATFAGGVEPGISTVSDPVATPLIPPDISLPVLPDFGQEAPPSKPQYSVAQPPSVVSIVAALASTDEGGPGSTPLCQASCRPEKIRF